MNKRGKPAKKYSQAARLHDTIRLIESRHGITIEELADGIVLRPARSFAKTTVDQVFGSLKYNGPPKSIDDMNRAIDDGFRDTWERKPK